jgi:hypothetical protein
MTVRGVLFCTKSIQSGLLAAVALMVDRGTIGRLLGLPADPSRALLPRVGPRTITVHEKCRHRPAGRQILFADFRMPAHLQLIAYIASMAE